MNISSAYLIVIICYLLFSNISVFTQDVKYHGQLKVKEVNILNKNNEIVVLKGVSFGWHNWWPRFYNSEIVKYLKEEWKCNVVRLAMGIEPENGYLKNPDWSEALIEKVVEAAIENDIYVVVDWHSHNIYIKEAIDFFTKIAKKYGDKPHLIYEIFNEPERISWEEVKRYSIEVINAIRQYDPDNIILVGCPHWDQDIHIVADNPILDYENIMYTVHFYAAAHKQPLRDKVVYALNKKIPIFVSECGAMNYDGNGSIDYDEWNKWMQLIYENKLSWIAWSIADKDETCSMLNKTASSTGNWDEKEIKEWGKLVLKTLKSF